MTFLKVLLHVFSSDEYNDADCEFAVVLISEEMAKEILRRQKLFIGIKQKDKFLSALAFNDLSCDFFTNHGEFPEDFQKKLDDLPGDPILLPENYDLSFLNDDLKISTTLDTLTIHENSFFWVSAVDNSPADVQTVDLPYTLLHQLV